MLEKIAVELREAAERLERLGKPPFVRQGINLVQAGEAISACHDTCCIEVKYWASGAGGPHLDFSVWNGKRHFESATLADAVNLCLAAHHAEQAKSDASKEAVDGLLEQVGAAPVPHDDSPF